MTRIGLTRTLPQREFERKRERGRLVLDRARSVNKLIVCTPNQIEWAARIKLSVNAEFDRVEKAFQATAAGQQEQDRMDTLAVLAILEEKRVEVMAIDDARYFIRDWQELNDQVRRMIAKDPRYHAIRTNRQARLREPHGG